MGHLSALQARLADSDGEGDGDGYYVRTVGGTKVGPMPGMRRHART